MKSPEAFRTISEVAAELDLPQHVLRFWESRFSQIKPVKRAGGRRYYRPDEIDLLRGIRSLLYGEGYTIKGVQKLLRERGQRFVIEIGRKARTRPLDAVPPGDAVTETGKDEGGVSLEVGTPPPAAPVGMSWQPLPSAQAPLLQEDTREGLELLLAELLTLKQRLRAVPRLVLVSAHDVVAENDSNAECPPDSRHEAVPTITRPTAAEVESEVSATPVQEPRLTSAALEAHVSESDVPDTDADKPTRNCGRGIGRRPRKDARSPRFDFGF